MNRIVSIVIGAVVKDSYHVLPRIMEQLYPWEVLGEKSLLHQPMEIGSWKYDGTSLISLQDYYILRMRVMVANWPIEDSRQVLGCSLALGQPTTIYDLIRQVSYRFLSALGYSAHLKDLNSYVGRLNRGQERLRDLFAKDEAFRLAVDALEASKDWLLIDFTARLLLNGLLRQLDFLEYYHHSDQVQFSWSSKTIEHPNDYPKVDEMVSRLAVNPSVGGALALDPKELETNQIFEAMEASISLALEQLFTDDYIREVNLRKNAEGWISNRIRRETVLPVIKRAPITSDQMPVFTGIEHGEVCLKFNNKRLVHAVLKDETRLD